MSRSRRKGGDGATKMRGGSPANPVPFGKYYLLGRIARGGMAEVYRAREIDDPHGELLAIKVMRSHLARESRFVDMFRREGQLAMLLRHPNIVRTLDVGDIKGCHYIAMEYIPGRDLTQVLRRCQSAGRRIPIPHAIFIATCIAEGLNEAHNLTGTDGRPLQLVNRDVSPSNVRLDYSGGVKLLDFGIAQALMKFTSEIGVLKGKFSYMSPEQIRGMPVDARTDIFSCGILIHEMLTTEKLFRGDTEFQLMEVVRRADIRPPSALNRRVSPEVDAVVLKALRRDVEQRYQTAAELAESLRGLLEIYRFQPKELAELMQSMFRNEVAKEQELCEQARTSAPRSPSRPGTPTPTTPTLVEDFGSVATSSPVHAPVVEPGGPVFAVQASPEASGGLWSRIKRKLRG
jgi:eukaryotic-like serine/threonine-protein kinase